MPDAYDAAVSLTQAHVNYDQNPADCPELGFPTTPCYLLETSTTSTPITTPVPTRSRRTRTRSCRQQPTCTGPVTKCDPTMNTAKRQTLADFDNFSLCDGQSQMAPIGYSPLPVNLVEASFRQVTLAAQGRPCGRRLPAQPRSLRQPDVHPRPSQRKLPSKDRPIASGVRQGGARAVSRPVRAQREPHRRPSRRQKGVLGEYSATGAHSSYRGPPWWPRVYCARPYLYRAACRRAVGARAAALGLEATQARRGQGDDIHRAPPSRCTSPVRGGHYSAARARTYCVAGSRCNSEHSGLWRRGGRLDPRDIVHRHRDAVQDVLR